MVYESSFRSGLFARVLHRGWWLFLCLIFIGHAAAAQCKFTQDGSQHHVSYSFEPIVSGEGMTLRVTLEFIGGDSGEAELEVPSTYAGQQNLSGAFTELKALSDKTSLTDASSGPNKMIQFAPRTSVRISYLLIKDWTGALNSDTRFRPILEQSNFQLLSDTALIKPRLKPESIQEVYFDWQKMPSNWSFASSFGADDRCQHFHGSWRKVQTALFVGGDYRVRHETVSGNDLVLATRGTWSFSDDEWATQVRRIIEMERTFWHDNDFPYLLVALAPLDQDGGSYGGSAYTNAFMMHLPRKATFSYEVVSLLAHENFHIWNPYKMGREQGTDLSWFTEGFTRYYTDLVLFRTHFLSLSQYIQHTNEKLRKYELSPARNISNAELVARRGSDRYLSDVAGEHGMVLALWLDSHIQQHTKNKASLDMVMLELVKKGENQGIYLTIDRIIRLSEKYLGPGDRRLLRRYIEEGTKIPPPEFVLANCVGIRIESAFQFELGFDEESLRKAFIVSGVKPDSEAFRSGIRDGQKIARVSVSWNDTSKLVKLTIRAADGDHAYEYYPRGGSRAISQYYIRADCSSDFPH
jgi:predicted metalloprotease with PDZ domain